jgi:hypothetical protein
MELAGALNSKKEVMDCNRNAYREEGVVTGRPGLSRSRFFVGNRFRVESRRENGRFFAGDQQSTMS